MKNSARCPKCESRRLWIVEPFRVPDDTNWPALPVATRLVGGAFLTQVVRMGGFDLYVCADCGFSELWARGLEEMEPSAETGVTLRDTTDPEQGPFR